MWVDFRTVPELLFDLFLGCVGGGVVNLQQICLVLLCIVPYCTTVLFGGQQKRCQDLDGREKTVQALLATGQQMLDTSRPEHVVQVTEKVKRLKDRWQDTRERAFKRKVIINNGVRSQIHAQLFIACAPSLNCCRVA